MAGTVERSDKRLVVALASALGFALLTIAFLLGRISAKPAKAVQRAGSGSSAIATQPSAVATVPRAESEPASTRAPSEVKETPLASASLPVPPAPLRENASVPAAAFGASPFPERPQIAAYFTQIERLEDMGAGDPQAFATSMLQSATSGDFSGFDDLLAKSKNQRDRLRSIVPPRACLEHHRLALSLAGDSVTMLERLKAALMKGDSAALMTMATEGQTLQTQTNQLKAMGEAIKRQAGL